MLRRRTFGAAFAASLLAAPRSDEGTGRNTTGEAAADETATAVQIVEDVSDLCPLMAVLANGRIVKSGGPDRAAVDVHDSCGSPCDPAASTDAGSADTRSSSRSVTSRATI